MKEKTGVQAIKLRYQRCPGLKHAKAVYRNTVGDGGTSAWKHTVSNLNPYLVSGLSIYKQTLLYYSLIQANIHKECLMNKTNLVVL